MGSVCGEKVLDRAKSIHVLRVGRASARRIWGRSLPWRAEARPTRTKLAGTPFILRQAQDEAATGSLMRLTVLYQTFGRDFAIKTCGAPGMTGAAGLAYFQQDRVLIAVYAYFDHGLSIAGRFAFDPKRAA